MAKNSIFISDESAINLSGAIIENAVDDYRKLLRKCFEKVKDYGLTDGSFERCREVEHFFGSEWFMYLSSVVGNLPGDVIVNTIRHQEYDEYTMNNDYPYSYQETFKED